MINFSGAVHKINERHDLLARTIGTRAEEDLSYETAQILLLSILLSFFFGSIVEIALYLIFTYKVLFIIFYCPI